VAASSLTAVLVDDVTSGTLRLVSDGTFTYMPHPGFSGTDFFTYRADNEGVRSNIATVTIDVIGTNDAPVTRNDVADTEQGVAVVIDVLANDTDDDGDGLVVEAVTAAPAHGAVAVNADDTVTYTPNAGFVGMDVFAYTAYDGTVTSNSATVTVTVSGGPSSIEPPVAQGDYIITTRNTSVTIDVLTNDDDPDGTIDPATVAIVSAPSRGGTVVVNGTGTVTYNPQYGFWGTETFSYTVADDGGNVSNEALVTVNVQWEPKGNMWWLWFWFHRS
jgi:hypothetical protein